MAELTSIERVMLALKRQEPDRVPHFEWLVNPRVRQALLPGCKTHHEFAVKMGHDAILVGTHFKKEQLGPDKFLSERGFTFEYGMEEHGVEIEAECPIKAMADFKKFTPPDLDAPGRYDEIEWAVREFKGDKAIGVHASWLYVLDQTQQDYRNEPGHWQGIAAYLPADGKIIALTQDYGYRLNYYGWRKVSLWPNRGEIKLSELRGDSKEFQSFFEKNTKDKGYFLITASSSSRISTTCSSTWPKITLSWPKATAT